MSVRVTDDRVFDAVLDIVSTAGYRGATTRRIAETAGINEVTLFRRWGDKKRLLGAAINHEIGQFRDAQAFSTGDVSDDLERVVDYFAHVFAHRDGIVVSLMLEAAVDPEVADLLREPSGVLSEIGGLLHSYQESGALRPEPTHDAVEALLGPLVLAAVNRRIGLLPRVEPPSAEHVVDGFLRGRARAAT